MNEPREARSVSLSDEGHDDIADALLSLRLAPDPPSRRVKSREVIIRRDGRRLKRMSLFIPVALEQPLRLYAARMGLDMSSAIVSIVWKRLVKEQTRPPKPAARVDHVSRRS
jgi:hypothetical protein